MLEFKVIQELKPNTEILEIIKSYTHITKKGKVKHLTNTNLQFWRLKSKQVSRWFELSNRNAVYVRVSTKTPKSEKKH